MALLSMHQMDILFLWIIFTCIIQNSPFMTFSTTKNCSRSIKRCRLIFKWNVNLNCAFNTMCVVWTRVLHKTQQNIIHLNSHQLHPQTVQHSNTKPKRMKGKNYLRFNWRLCQIFIKIIVFINCTFTRDFTHDIVLIATDIQSRWEHIQLNSLFHTSVISHNLY